jgi:hypothetical protein
MSANLTPTQQAAIGHARALAAIPSGDDEAIAARIGHADLTTVYAAAYGNAKATIRELLEIIDSLTGGAR